MKEVNEKRGGGRRDKGCSPRRRILLGFRSVCVSLLCIRLCSDSDSEFVDPQTISLARKREVYVVESKGYMNIDGAPVKKAPPTISRKATLPHSSAKSAADNEITLRRNHDRE